MSRTHPYRGLEVVLTTKHGKQRVLAGPLADHPGLRLRTVALDTDCLGTFTGERERPAGPRETALLKARMGLQATGARRGLASEGAYGAHPDSPFVPLGLEFLAFVDTDLGLEVVEMRRTRDAVLDATTVPGPGERLERFLARIGFGPQGVVVRPGCAGNAGKPVATGVRTRAALEQALSRALAASADGRARVETDMRAHHNPARMREIAALGQSLARRLGTLCPECATPAYGFLTARPGLPCGFCGTPTAHVLEQEHGCLRCPRREIRRPVTPGAPTADCPVCNP